LSARINVAKFKANVGAGIAAKMNLIRKLGNHAVHDQKPIPPRAALDALGELHRVMVWATFHRSANPQAVPLKAVFDSALARKAAPLTPAEVAQLAEKFKAQDEAHAKALAEKDELACNQLRRARRRGWERSSWRPLPLIPLACGRAGRPSTAPGPPRCR
jgi:type I restriction enzyme, R subunit